MAHTTKADFASKFDLGYPMDPADNIADRDVLILYAKGTALPTKMREAKSKTIDFVTAEEATENCDFMHVLTRNRGGAKNTCLALVPNYESYHLQAWGRIPMDGPGGKEYPLRLIPRGLQSEDGNDDWGVPTQHETKQTWKALTQYFTTYEKVLADVKRIVQKVKFDSTVIVRA
jgi:hypothetical protein